MKKLLLIFITLLGFNKNNAQIVFCPPGAEWHYLYVEDNLSQSPVFKNEMVKYTGDSIVSGETVKVLMHSKIFYEVNEFSISQTFIKQHGDTVFMKNVITNNQWQILFNYAALPGHSWQIPLSVYNNLTYTVTVDSVNSVVINGFTLKRLFVKYAQGTTHNYSAVIVERIGGSGDYFLFNFFGAMHSDGDYMQEFLCYRDNTFGLKQFSAHSCDYIIHVGIGETQENERALRIYPNPASDLLNIELENQKPTENCEIRLLNVLGKEILSPQKIKNGSGNLVLDLSDIETGIYFVQVFEKGKLICTEKIVKE